MKIHKETAKALLGGIGLSEDEIRAYMFEM